MNFTDRERVRLFILSKMPRVLIQETFEVFTAILCISSGLPLAFGRIEAESIEASVPHHFAHAWGIVLLIGAILTLTGLIVANAVSGPRALQRMITGHRIERLGLLALAWAGGVYAVSVLLAVGKGGIIASTIILIFALTCLTRAFVLSTGATMLHRALVSAARDFDLEA
jgi:hypothetical protein